MDIFQMLITENRYVKPSVRTATQQLHLKTNKFTALQKIHKTDSAGNCTVLYSFVQFCTVLYSFVQFCTVLYSFVQFCTVLYSFVQFCTRFCVAMNSATVNPLLIYFTDDA